MGAFIGIGESGVWTSNRERDAFLDWFAEFRCQAGDERWHWCKSEAQRWTGRCLDLSEFLQADQTLRISDAEDSIVRERYGQNVARLLKNIEKIRQGQWSATIDSKEATDWRDGE